MASRSAARAWAAFDDSLESCERSVSSIWNPTRYTGSSEVIGSWKIIDTPLPRTRDMARSLCPSSSWPRYRTEPVTRADAGSRPITASEVDRLARPGLADDAQHLTGPQGVVHAADGVHEAVLGGETDVEVLDGQQRRVGVDGAGLRAALLQRSGAGAHACPPHARTRRLLGSKASRIPSPIRLIDSTMISRVMPGK